MVDSNTFYISTDIHVENVGEEFYNPENSAGTANYLAYIALANAANPLAAINLGDMGQTSYNIEEVGGYIDTLNNAVTVIGNHDIWPVTGREVVSDNKSLAVSEYNLLDSYYAQDIGFCKLIILDSNHNISGQDDSSLTGYLTAAQRTWLTNEIASTQQKAIIICVHHPPLDGWWGEEDLQALESAIGERVNVWILCGHLHAVANTVYTIGNAVIHNLAPIVFGKYSIATVQYMSNGFAKFTLTQQSIP